MRLLKWAHVLYYNVQFSTGACWFGVPGMTLSLYRIFNAHRGRRLIRLFCMVVRTYLPDRASAALTSEEALPGLTLELFRLGTRESAAATHSAICKVFTALDSNSTTFGSQIAILRLSFYCGTTFAGALFFSKKLAQLLFSPRLLGAREEVQSVKRGATFCLPLLLFFLPHFSLYSLISLTKLRCILSPLHGSLLL